jgi:hypothetical protein
MGRYWFLLVLVLILPIVSAGGNVSSSNYEFEKTEVDTGGGNTSSTNFGLFGIIGQFFTGNLSSSNYGLEAGFLNAENNLPGAPSLLLPADESIVIDLTPTLNWTVPVDIDGDDLHFQVQIANDSGFSEIVVNTYSGDDTTGFSPTPPLSQSEDTDTYTTQSDLDFRQYYWKVRAHDGTSYGPYSSVYSFNVTTSVICSFSNLNISFGSLDPEIYKNASLNYAGASGETFYNLTSDSNINVNVTHQSTDLDCTSQNCLGLSIDVRNVTWQSNVSSAIGENMNFGNGVALQNNFDLNNKVAESLAVSDSAHLRYWIGIEKGLGGGTYVGNYTIRCEQA